MKATEENNYGKINVLEEIKIVKAASSPNVLNDNGRSDPICKILPSVSA